MLAVAFTHVLYGGMALALAASDHLFKLDMGEKIYARLWFVLAGVFQTAYLALGIPRSEKDWRARGLHPALAFLPRYILLPLGILYAAVLYAYAGKAIVLREWPRGWASSLILVFSGVMILTLLLLDRGEVPSEGIVNGEVAKELFNRDSSRLAHGRLTRRFFTALAPLLVLLFLAVGLRIHEYGVTEERYVGIALALWLTAMTAAHLFLGRTLVVGIPATLGLLALLVSGGPWGAFSASTRSQWHRLEKELTEAGRLRGGRLRHSETKAPKGLEESISAHLNWMEERQDTEAFQAWLSKPGEDCSDCIAAWKGWPGAAGLAQKLNIAYQSRYGGSSPPNHDVDFHGLKHRSSVSVSGYRSLMTLGDSWTGDKEYPIWFDGVDRLLVREKEGTWRIAVDGRPEIKVSLAPLEMRLRDLGVGTEYIVQVPVESLYVDTVHAGRHWRFLFQSVQMDTSAVPPVLKSYSEGLLLMGPHFPTP